MLTIKLVGLTKEGAVYQTHQALSYRFEDKGCTGTLFLLDELRERIPGAEFSICHGIPVSERNAWTEFYVMNESGKTIDSVRHNCPTIS